MKSTPILFNADMVRALLIGAKTQTRRVMKVQPPSAEYKLLTCIDTTGNKKDKGRHHWITMQDQYSVDDSQQPYFSCPFGYAGDQLWVRETFSAMGDETRHAATIFYRADRPNDNGRWTPSIHMPRWASRIQLAITGVRVERLNDCSEADAYAEGAANWAAENRPLAPNGEPDKFNTCVQAYKALWESINGEGSWAANPWVWVIEFEVLK